MYIGDNGTQLYLRALDQLEPTPIASGMLRGPFVSPDGQLIAMPAREDTPRISPDGRWLAFETDETGADEIFVRPFPDINQGRWRISTRGGLDPMWAPDGRRLYYRSGQSIMAVAINAGPPSGWGLPERLFQLEGRYLLNTGATHLDISPDGRRFLLIKEGGSDESAAPPQIIVVHNWFEELKRLVPAQLATRRSLFAASLLATVVNSVQHGQDYGEKGDPAEQDEEAGHGCLHPVATSAATTSVIQTTKLIKAMPVGKWAPAVMRDANAINVPGAAGRKGPP